MSISTCDIDVNREEINGNWTWDNDVNCQRNQRNIRKAETNLDSVKLPWVNYVWDIFLKIKISTNWDILITLIANWYKSIRTKYKLLWLLGWVWVIVFG